MTDSNQNKVLPLPENIKTADEVYTHKQEKDTIQMFESRSVAQYLTRPLALDNSNVPVNSGDKTTWELDDYSARWIPYGDFTWTTSQVIADSIFVLQPFKTIVNDTISYFQKIALFHSYVRFDVQIRVQLNTTRFHTGRLICFYIPENKNIEGNGNLTAFTCAPHAILDAAVANTVDFSVPWCSQFDFISTAQELLTGGTIMCNVAAPLTVASGTSDTVHGKIWIRALNAQFKVPGAPHAYRSILPQSGTLETVINEAETGEIGHQLLNKATKLAQVVSPLVRTLCLDYPNAIQNGDINSFSATSLSNAEGVSKAKRLAPTQLGVYTNSPDISHKEDDFRYLASMPSVALVWDPKLPMMLPVSPRLLNPLLESANHVYTWVNFVSSLHAFWRGSLRFKIDFVTSSFTTGRFAVSWVPSLSANLPNITAFNAFSMYPTVVMDLAEARVFEFEVPYINNKPWLNSIDYAKTGTNQLYYSNACHNGMLVFYILNDPVFTGSTSDYLQAWVWVSGGTDFEVAAHRAPIDNEVAVPQSGALVVKKLDLATGDQIIKAEEERVHNIGEDYMNMDAILKRYSLLYALRLPGQYSTYLRVRPVMRIGTSTAVDPPITIPHALPWIDIMGSAYTFWSGSMRFKFIMHSKLETVGGMFTVSWVPFDVYSSTSDIQFKAPSAASTYYVNDATYSTEIQLMPNMKSFDVEVPYTSIYNKLFEIGRAHV